MSTVKNVIAILCKHLNTLLKTDYKPEQFRLAKFNKNNNNLVEEFWKLLYLLLKDNYSFAFTKNESIVTCVKLQFCYLNYNNIHFYSLPEDMSHGSQELLLAVGWLISSEHILFNLTNNRLRNSLLSKEYDNDIKETLSKVELQKNIHLDINKEENINYILWLAGNIQHNLNCIEIAQEDRVKLISKLHDFTKNSSGLPHLSVSDVKFIKNPEMLQKYINELKSLSELLETYNSWDKQSYMFWEWMQSVLVEKYSKPSGDYFNTIDKQNLSHIMEKIRTKLISLISCDKILTERHPSLSLKLSTQPPRYILDKSNHKSEITTWLMQSKEQINDFSKLFSQIQNDMKTKLRNVGQSMSDKLKMVKAY